MTWKIRHQGSPQAKSGLSLAQIAEGLRDGLWEPTDEVMGPNEAKWVSIENHPALAEIAEELEPPPTRHPDETHLDMNALIDVCLVLLIFFMITTSYAVAVQKVVPLPEVSNDKVKKATRKEVRNQMVAVKADADINGVVTILIENQKLDVLKSDQRTLDREKFRQALMPFTRGEPRKTEMFLETGDITWGLVIAIQDAGKQAGIRTVHHRAK